MVANPEVRFAHVKANSVTYYINVPGNIFGRSILLP